LEETRATRTAVERIRTPKEPWPRFLITVLVGLAAALVYLYIAGPDVEAVDVSVECPLCDQNGPFTPSANVDEANSGALFSVKIQNSGQMGTKIVGHNISLYTTEPGQKPVFNEEPHANDSVAVWIGSRSSVTLSLSRGAEIAYFMTHPRLRPPQIDYLYGYVEYRNAFLIPTTKRFCFQYQPGAKGLRGKWVVCSV